jgi:NAD(P)-dependent dehydrogenase (short-subunit alcohol dehydrogenase family)
VVAVAQLSQISLTSPTTKELIKYYGQTKWTDRACHRGKPRHWPGRGIGVCARRGTARNLFRQRLLGIDSGQRRDHSAVADYAAAKGGIVAFTKTVANELKAFNIQVNRISPVADTRMTEN